MTEGAKKKIADGTFGIKTNSSAYAAPKAGAGLKRGRAPAKKPKAK